ncbi:Outer membrane protein TolC [Mucilaginibacter lappiensis]|uniref:Outer membrane protein TolC n=1 Tax=Mucilaginibacter lappiensis TaxID=354630 RepID=A0ABR6PK40_9SPHI|nr:TolC family protein [Mucilaginibacter lappiensis]MBB6110095.1 outer membrane protein TolC [Mucilaginibacter lappiensis]SIR53192.1 Outer membrane protein TolC [Mucilaginibacter lappiensis]
MKILYIISLLTISTGAFGRSNSDTLRLTLQQVVEMAKSNSIAAKQAATVRETKYWEYRTYKSNYQPQLALSGILPGYQKTFSQVLQPDGTIQFQPIHNDNSSLQLNFSQSITATGGTIYGTTQLQRFDDFDRHNVLYNGIPYGIGYTQPLFQFNSLKWDKRIEPLKYNESKQAYIEAQENIAITVEGFFFDLLLAQVNLHIAETNYTNTQKIMSIANTKFELGKVSKNEILQLQLELINAKKAVGTAKRDMEIATLNLRSYTGQEDENKIVLVVPENISQMTVTSDKVLAEAFANRSDAIAFLRRVAEAKRDVAKAKGQNGLTATLTANLGFSNTSTTIPGVYKNPQNQQVLQVQLAIPILDWGRQKSRAKTAQANQQFTEYAVEQDKQTFKQQIVTQVSLFNVMKEQLVYTAEADSIASEKYQIARERYVLGDLSITDLGIAFRENDQAKRDYITSLRDFWGAYYQLRYLSLYDFETNHKISYQ